MRPSLAPGNHPEVPKTTLKNAGATLEFICTAPEDSQLHCIMAGMTGATTRSQSKQKKLDELNKLIDQVLDKDPTDPAPLALEKNGIRDVHSLLSLTDASIHQPL